MIIRASRTLDVHADTRLQGHSKGTKWKPAAPFPKDVTASIIAPTTQASIDTASALAKSHPDMLIVLRDLDLYRGIHEPDHDKSDKVFEEILIEAGRVLLSFAAKGKDGTHRVSSITAALEGLRVHSLSVRRHPFQPQSRSR